MEEVLRQLLTRLEGIGESSEELYDTECREQMGDAVMNGFVRATSDYVMPSSFGLHSAEANQAVREALSGYVEGACAKATEQGLIGFHERLAAFQNPDVESDGEGSFFDDFFGYVSPEAFDASGNVIGQP